jgi:hypothetical protein
MYADCYLLQFANDEPFKHLIFKMFGIDHESYNDCIGNSGVWIYFAIYYAIIHLKGASL